MLWRFLQAFQLFQVSILVHPFHWNRRQETISNNKTGPLLLDQLMRRQVLAAFYRGTQRWFLVNPLKSLYQVILNTFGSLAMHSKRLYKICTCSFIFGELEVFRNNGSVIFAIPENFRCNCTFYESENFSFSSHNRIFEYENFRFLFLRKLAKQIAENGVRLPLDGQLCHCHELSD